jgi:hypothetical protein
VVIGLAIHALTGAQGGLTDALTTVQLLAFTISAMLFVLSVLGWGSWFNTLRPSRFPILTSLLWGAIFFSTLSGLAGFCNFLGSRNSIFFEGVYLLGLWGAGAPLSTWVRNLGKSKVSQEQWLAFGLTAIVLLFVLRLCLQIPTAISEFDEYLYHLYAPWRWWQSGRISFDVTDPYLYLASYWEYLYLWAFPLLGDRGNLLFGTMIFAQTVHAILGFGGVLLALNVLFKSARIPHPWSALAAVYGTTSFAFFWTSWTGKNDYGALFFLLGSLVILRLHRFFLFGVLAGWAIAAKATSFLCLALAPFLWILISPRLWRSKKPARWGSLAFLAIAGGVLGLAPHVIRNFVGTRDPLFPMLLNRFPSPFISRTMLDVCYGVIGQSQNTAKDFLPALRRIVLSEPLNLAGILALLWVVKCKSNRRLFWLLSIGFFPLFIGAIWLGRMVADDVYLRYFAPSFCLLQSGGIAALGFWGSRRLGLFAQRVLFLTAFCAFLPVRSYIPWAAVTEPIPAFAEEYRSQMTGAVCKLWMAEHLGVEDSILSIEDFSLFLLPFTNIRVAVQEPILDQLFRASSGPETMLTLLRQEKFRYLFHSLPRGLPPLYPSAIAILRWAQHQTSGVLISGEDCVVLDLDKIGK